MLSTLGAEMPFASISRFVERWSGVPVSAKRVERSSESFGVDAEEDERALSSCEADL